MVLSDNRPVFQGSHLALSMRSSGYKNTAYALAEIIDNGVEAKAKNIEVLCAQKQNDAADPPIKQIEQIAVFDNGIGMTEEELWNSLIMGEGTRYEAKGIGKFGMGLPNSSISQCKHVMVYSWKKPDSVFFAEMNFDSMTDHGLSVKRPTKTEIPQIWKDHSKYLKTAESGTLVIWNKIDRVQWKKPKTLATKLERIVGRIYRKFLHSDKLEIRFASFDSDTNEQLNEYVIRPNDPLYRMCPSNTPEPWNKKPMFEIDGDKLEDKVRVEGHDVIVRYTMAKRDARKIIKGIPAGSQSHGKHANSNLGISVIRANRELYMDTNLCQRYDPLERWWGVEVEFPTALDDVFGVTHNKQDASHFSSMTDEFGTISRSETYADQAAYDGSDDLRKLVEGINVRIRVMRVSISKTNAKLKDKDNGTSPKHEPEDPDPGPTKTSEQENMSDAEKEKDIVDALSYIYDHTDATKTAREILENKIKTKLLDEHLGTSRPFFDVSLKGGVAIVVLNKDHRAYKHLVTATEELSENLTPEQSASMRSLRGAINLLFISWAYYENHLHTDDDRETAADVRHNWSRRLSELMKTIEN